MASSKNQLKKNLGKRSPWRSPWLYLAILVGLGLLAFAAMQIPAVERRVQNLASDIYYRFNPPSENVFDPSQQGTLDASVLASLTAMAPTQTPLPEQTPIQDGNPAQPISRSLPPWGFIAACSEKAACSDHGKQVGYEADGQQRPGDGP